MVGHANELESSFSQLQAYTSQAHCDNSPYSSIA